MTETISPFYSKLNKCANAFYTTLATIELTNRCNARCEYCYIDKEMENAELSTSQLHQIIEKIDSGSILSVNITGGEPFLRNDIIEILEHLFESNIFHISIFSNGTLLTKEHISFLEKYHTRISPFRMTVFSHDENIHDSYMKIPGSLQTIINNGNELMQRGVDVNLAIPVLMENYQTIGESIEFFINLGFPTGINLIKLISGVNNSETIAHMNSEDFFCTLIASLKSHSINISFCSDLNNNQLCQGLKTSIMIDTKGNIHPCTAFRDFIIGSIFEPLPLHDLLKKNGEYLKLRSITKDDLICAGCQHYNQCSPCLARQHSLNHSIDGPYPSTCNLTRAIYKLSTKAKE